MSVARAVCWIRRDLRLEDHAALEAATIVGETAVLFVFDQCILSQLKDRDDRRISFIFQCLEDIGQRLREKGSDLIVRFGDPVEVVPKFAHEFGASVVVAGRDYEPYAVGRDRRVHDRLSADGRELRLVRDHLFFEPGEILSISQEPFSVFTPFQKRWLGQFDIGRIASRSADLSNLAQRGSLEKFLIPYSFESVGFLSNYPGIPGGSTAAQVRLKEFQGKMAEYGSTRDFPSIEGTSTISPYLRFGCISAASAFRLAAEYESEGSQKWRSELIWREFYQHVLAHWPHVEQRSFRPKFDAIDWPGDLFHLDLWKSGQTGFPIVDAAMRCFSATGWMHNRLRMVVASFLTKDLLLDYRLGEAHFARYLLDFELASNNGGWQWSASTGCDAQPYFRIFNPELQSRRFDANGDFIRKWAPELSGFDSNAIHAPIRTSRFDQLAAGCVIGVDYPEPIVDHAIQKSKALSLFSMAGDSHVEQ